MRNKRCKSCKRIVFWPTPHKTCLRCRRYQKKWYINNRETKRAKAKAYRELHPELNANRKRDYSIKHKHWKYKRRYTLRKLYGMTLEEYERMFAKQKGACAICEQASKRRKREWLHVDHDHSSGKIRELLCKGCNTGIGFFKDNRKLLKRAIAYLEKHS